MEFERQSGIFLHPTSLPGKYGIGTLGKEAYEFVDFLAESKQKLWQICPLGPTGYGDSPYQALSSFAGNPMLISLEKLVDEDLLSEKDLTTELDFAQDRVEYGKVIEFKTPLLKKAFANFSETKAYYKFKLKHKSWLDDYALFRAVKDDFNEQPWSDWDDEIKFRQEEAIAKYEEELASEIEFYKFTQYIFFKQWQEIKEYANQNGVKIVGDIPIFVAMDSADTWSNPELFFFDDEMNATKVAGVPPDYFSETGQLWGNPLYDWDKMKENNYSWWMKRISAMLDIADILRIDHFRGFAGYWAIPAGEDTAINGEWEDGPGADFFETVKKELGELPIIVEDLGFITDDVVELKNKFDFPGMQILQFGFDGTEHNNVPPDEYTTDNCVVYTGTHDNNTSLGWYNEDATKSDREHFQQYIQDYLDQEHDSIAWNFIELAWSSRAKIAFAPLQDVLSLDSQARFNVPGTLGGNWEWKYRVEMLTEERKEKLKDLTIKHNR